MELYDEIGRLIDLHQEGSYWDLKKEWYGKDKDSDQLIDILLLVLMRSKIILLATSAMILIVGIHRCLQTFSGVKSSLGIIDL